MNELDSCSYIGLEATELSGSSKEPEQLYYPMNAYVYFALTTVTI
jgi:hypothetical protein